MLSNLKLNNASIKTENNKQQQQQIKQVLSSGIQQSSACRDSMATDHSTVEKCPGGEVGLLRSIPKNA